MDAKSRIHAPMDAEERLQNALFRALVEGDVESIQHLVADDPVTRPGVARPGVPASAARCAPASFLEGGCLATMSSVRRRKALYWLVTGLMAAFMLAASIPDLLRAPLAVAVFTHLGYPIYLLPFLGVAKALGVVGVLLPGFRRLREWAYAGLVFDLLGALFSHLSVGDPPGTVGVPVIGLVLVAASYLCSLSIAPGSEEYAWTSR